jgi:IS1 family transposase
MYDQPTEQELNSGVGKMWVFVALDKDTRLVPCFRVGRRDYHTTWNFIADLRQCLKLKHDTLFPLTKGLLDGEPMPDVKITTDGFPGYKAAIEDVFKHAVAHGQIVKNYTKKWRKKKKSTKPFMKKQRFSMAITDSEISTSLVERHNLQLRTFIRRLVRKTSGFSKKLHALHLAVAMQVAHYNYCWRLRTLRTTPAVAAGITDEPWPIERFYDEVAASAVNGY